MSTARAKALGWAQAARVVCRKSTGGCVSGTEDGAGAGPELQGLVGLSFTPEQWEAGGGFQQEAMRSCLL